MVRKAAFDSWNGKGWVKLRYIMQPVDFEQLLCWSMDEYRRNGTLFGVQNITSCKGGKGFPLLGARLETPIGVAAGPQTQMAQNILSAYVAGARHFELKTVQVLDGRDLAECLGRPCINARDEGYNYEWSTELTVQQALEEYIKAWFLLHIIGRELDLGEPGGFLFDMSVGYDLNSLRSKKVDDFLNTMGDASQSAFWQGCKKTAISMLPLFSRVDKNFVENISPHISNVATLSTLHRCHALEIGAVASYLLESKGLHTFVKCNPTLLEHGIIRRLLDDAGYHHVVYERRHIQEDLSLEEAVHMTQRLSTVAKEMGLTFGLKLTNAFWVETKAKELPDFEMFMSGRPLFLLSVHALKLLSEKLRSEVPIVYCGGVDAHNLQDLLALGVFPVSMVTTLLKPGGYNRLAQLAQMSRHVQLPQDGLQKERLASLCRESLRDVYYKKAMKPLPEWKNPYDVPMFDCFMAPCQESCPISQDIPAYIRLSEEGRHKEALRKILIRNPLPHVTGAICAHPCMDRCVRGFYEQSVDIRQIKYRVTQDAYQEVLDEIVAPSVTVKNKRVAVVGSGPAGIACAHFLARAGVSVTVFEQEQEPGGTVRWAVPDFRLHHADVRRDIALAKAWGAKFRCGVSIDSLHALKEQGFTHIVVAIGAGREGLLIVEGQKPLDAKRFLTAFRQSPSSIPLGENVVVIGGGNTAIDAARAAVRVPGVKSVTIAYRRNLSSMPADEGEINLALDEGIQVMLLLQPLSWQDRKLYCAEMALGKPDNSGRPTPIDMGDRTELPADAVIAAVGQQVDREQLRQWGLGLDQYGYAQLDQDTLESTIPGVYVAGDARRGPATVVQAIADAAKIASAIHPMDFEGAPLDNIAPDEGSARKKKGKLCLGGHNPPQNERCLQCATVCEHCVDVCPNRANISVRLEGFARPQVIHLDGLCNACGNCNVFCPYGGSPHEDKVTVFWSEQDFLDSMNTGFVCLDPEQGLYHIRYLSQKLIWRRGDPPLDREPRITAMLSALEKAYPHYLFG